MYGVIYVDVLVLVNTIAGWFMLRCAAAFARRTQRPARMLTAAVTAGFSSLAILLPPLPAVGSHGNQARSGGSRRKDRIPV